VKLVKLSRPVAIAAALLLSAALSAPASAQAPSPQELQRGKEFMQKSMGMMKPELLEQAKALPPEIQQFLLKVAIRHSRHSETLTMRQVMQEILADYQAVAGAIATDNGELAADAARRIADHRLPRGGMLPYLPLEKINGKDLGVLPAMEEAVEGSARRLAAAAEKGDMVMAAQQFGTMTSGCVACHAHFRGQPGVSARIK
jgi:cytochrome c556